MAQGSGTVKLKKQRGAAASHRRGRAGVGSGKAVTKHTHAPAPKKARVGDTSAKMKLLGSFANAIEADVMRVASREVKNFQMLKGVMLEAQKPKPKGAPGHAVNTKKQKKKKKEEDAARRLLEQAKAKKEEEARKRGGKRIKKPSRHEQKHQLPKDALGLPKER